MVYTKLPTEFNPAFEVAACYLEHNGDILILHRQENKPEGDTWGLPAGKIDMGEDKFSAVLREVKEETGFIINRDKLEELESLYVKYSDYDFIYHMFKVKLDNRPEIKIREKEHKGYQWLPPSEILKLKLVRDLDECLKMSYGK